MILQNAAAQREAKAQFDISRLVDLSEQVLLDCLAAQVLSRSPFSKVLYNIQVGAEALVAICLLSYTSGVGTSS
jgi:hypothetical protein